MFQVKSLGQNWEQNLTLTEHPILILFSMVNSSVHLSAFRPLEAAGPCLTSRFHRPDVHTVHNKALLSTYTHKGRVDGGKEKRATRYSRGSFLSQLESQYIGFFDHFLPENLSQLIQLVLLFTLVSWPALEPDKLQKDCPCKVSPPQGSRSAVRTETPDTPRELHKQPPLGVSGFPKGLLTF